MRIGDPLPPVYTRNPAPEPPANAPARHSLSVEAQPSHTRPAAGITVEISPEAWAAYARDTAGSGSAARQIAAAENAGECKTCAGRTYQDGSSDPSVSYQMPTHISPGQAAASVAAHESEHVSNEQAKAEREGRKIVSQTVTLQTSICPECKRVYVSGGTTRTLSVQDSPAGAFE